MTKKTKKEMIKKIVDYIPKAMYTISIAMCMILIFCLGVLCVTMLIKSIIMAIQL
jgi:hypothetical protein